MSEISQPLELRILVFKGRRKWVAQCLEFDIAAQADRREDLRDSFVRAVEAEVEFCGSHDLTPLRRLPQAPPRYFETWDQLQTVATAEVWGDMPAYIASARTSTAVEATVRRAKRKSLG